MSLFKRKLHEFNKKSWKEVMGEWSDNTTTWTTSIVQSPYNPPPPKDPIETAADDVLIFELIKRGYAVAKMPAEELAKVASA